MRSHLVAKQRRHWTIAWQCNRPLKHGDSRYRVLGRERRLRAKESVTTDGSDHRGRFATLFGEAIEVRRLDCSDIESRRVLTDAALALAAELGRQAARECFERMMREGRS